ncbi:hypothetical protein NECAME_17620 [Necator americanus]|uniref:beta-N-acetylhexosaminidase n=1 Tax=Necator americanus TaxID=51031 RepID=W2TMI1_NECAM|nr:hypothetical protein NECAME_17620 [Necator americanus]ETN82859.1 hypothetical protein NECAME_17620 [Necator americanus]
MVLRFVRKPRGGCLKLLYLSGFACLFFFLSSQLKNSQSFAKAIVAPFEKDRGVHPLPEESKEYGNHEHPGGAQKEQPPLPIIKNEDGDGVDPDRVDGPDALLVEYILKEAKRQHLEVIPLVQTFGHLEWVLKLERFAHLREDSRFPQVICFPEPEAWKLITDMIDQVAAVHKKYGMPFFHMGGDEAFQVGVCNASIMEMGRQGSRDRLMLWHISRTAKYIKTVYSTTVLAWHDMFGHAMEFDLAAYHMTEVLEPVLWSYAEDLDLYLPKTTWLSLKPFRRVWGSSAWKGADGPARFNSNPIHYIRNHEAWIEQMTRNYNEFDVLQGIILAGWSRYDHFAILCELAPVALPTLAMSMETILEGRPLQGNYPISRDALQCTPSTNMGVIYGCTFPGHKAYELINEYWQRRKQLQQYREDDFELNGWLSRVAEVYSSSSQWYIDKIEPLLDYHAKPILRLEKELRNELARIYYQSMTFDNQHQLSALDQHVAPGLRLWMLIALVSGVLLIMADERTQAIVMNSMRPKSSSSANPMISEQLVVDQPHSVHKGSRQHTEV